MMTVPHDLWSDSIETMPRGFVLCYFVLTLYLGFAIAAPKCNEQYVSFSFDYFASLSFTATLIVVGHQRRQQLCY